MQKNLLPPFSVKCFAMAGVNKSNLTETDIITKFILPSLREAGWDAMTKIRPPIRPANPT
jgi:type I site-specific restriction endonuclease